jgi:hypothetical protein
MRKEILSLWILLAGISISISIGSLADIKAARHRKEEIKNIAERLNRNEDDILEVYRQFTNSAAVFNENFRRIESARLMEVLKKMNEQMLMPECQYVTGITTNGAVLGDKSYRIINGIMVEVEE